MKRLILILITATALVVALQVAGPNLRKFADNDRNWNRDMALMGNDMTVLLKYQPTQTSTHAGQVRKTMQPVAIYP